MALPDVEKSVADYLKDEGFDNVYRGGEKQPSDYIAHDSIFVMVFDNDNPQSFLSGGKGPQHHTPQLQIMVRSKPHEEETSRDTAYEVYDAIRDSSTSEISYIKVTSGPLRLGSDDDDIYRWTINIAANFIA